MFHCLPLRYPVRSNTTPSLLCWVNCITNPLRSVLPPSSANSSNASTCLPFSNTTWFPCPGHHRPCPLPLSCFCSSATSCSRGNPSTASVRGPLVSSPSFSV